MSGRKLTINRAPVLTLWAAVVAEQLGHDRETALTLGKALAGLNAQSKGQRLGIFTPSGDGPAKGHHESAATARDRDAVPLMGRQVPVVELKGVTRAAVHGEAIDPASVTRYLEKAFGDDLEAARGAFERLARSRSTALLATQGFALYEKFRPGIPPGQKGWGAKGLLDLDLVEALAAKK